MNRPGLHDRIGRHRLPCSRFVMRGIPAGLALRPTAKQGSLPAIDSRLEYACKTTQCGTVHATAATVRDGCPRFAPAYSGFHVELAGAGALHAAFLKESHHKESHHRIVILSGAPHRFIARYSACGAESKDPGGAILPMLFGAFQPPSPHREGPLYFEGYEDIRTAIAREK
jgi:hypothetical protein